MLSYFVANAFYLFTFRNRLEVNLQHYESIFLALPGGFLGFCFWSILITCCTIFVCFLCYFRALQIYWFIHRLNSNVLSTLAHTHYRSYNAARYVRRPVSPEHVLNHNSNAFLNLERWLFNFLFGEAHVEAIRPVANELWRHKTVVVLYDVMVL